MMWREGDALGGDRVCLYHFGEGLRFVDLAWLDLRCVRYGFISEKQGTGRMIEIT